MRGFPKEPERLEDGRMRCVYCGRYFSDERIEKHQVVVGWKGEWLDGVIQYWMAWVKAVPTAH